MSLSHWNNLHHSIAMCTNYISFGCLFNVSEGSFALKYKMMIIFASISSKYLQDKNQTYLITTKTAFCLFLLIVCVSLIIVSKARVMFR